LSNTDKGAVGLILALDLASLTCFCVDRKELTPELLFEVSPRLDRKNASVRLLAKEVLRPPRGMSVFEKGEGPKDFLLIAAELLRSQAQI